MLSLTLINPPARARRLVRAGGGAQLFARMAGRLAALSKAKTKAFTHRNREASKFQFDLTVHSLNGLDHAPATEIVVQIARGPKVVVTGIAPVTAGEARWEESKTLVCTLYASKSTSKLFSDKAFVVKLLALKKGVPRLELATAELNLGGFASIDARGHPVSHTLRLTPKGAPRAPSGPELHLTIGSTYLKDLEVDPDEQSISSELPGFGAAPSSRADASEQDLRGFDDGDGRSGGGGGCTNAETEAAARRSADVAELRSVRQGLTEDIQRRRGARLHAA